MTPLGFPLGDHGRLGNQLFQLAATVGIARQRKAEIMVDEDWPYLPFFSIPDEWVGKGRYIDVRSYVGGNHYRQTYLQDPTLWADVADEIRAAFAPSGRARAVLDSLPEPGPDDVAVHVRRGDYLTMPDHLPFVGSRHLRLGASMAAAHIHARQWDEPSFHVYTDDPAWCSKTLPWPVVSMQSEGDEPTDWLDLFRMARYRNLIIANSSYSWWSAFLAGPEATVCYPSVWFGPKIDVPSPALPEWIEVPA